MIDGDGGRSVVTVDGTPGVVCRKKTYTYLNQVVRNRKSTAKHTCDGKFTGWSKRGQLSGEYPNYDELASTATRDGNTRPTALHEWHDIAPVRGRFTNIYFDFDGEYLHVLNDWIYNDDPLRPVYPECFNLFEVWTGGGTERWTIKVFGDQTTEVTRNGEAAKDNCGATGNSKYSPKDTKNPHTIFELSFKVKPGGFGMKLADPGPRFACNVIEEEVAKFVGILDKGGGSSVSPTNDFSWDNRVDVLPAINACTSPPDPDIPPPNCSGSSNATNSFSFGQVQPAPLLYGRVPHKCDGGFTDFVTDAVLNGTRFFDERYEAPYPYFKSRDNVGFPIQQNPRGSRLEWTDIAAIEADLMRVYIDNRNETEVIPGRGEMHVMIDWFTRFRQGLPLGPDCYNWFAIQTRGIDYGEDALARYDELGEYPEEYWMFRVYGDNTVHAELNGKVIMDRYGTVNRTDLVLCAKYGFGYSLDDPTLQHSVNEYTLALKQDVDYSLYFATKSERYTCDVMDTSGVGISSNQTGVFTKPFDGNLNAKYNLGCSDIDDSTVLVINVTELSDRNGCLEDLMEENSTWFNPKLTKSKVEKIVHGPFGREMGCAKARFVGFEPNEANISISIRFMSFDNWNRGKTALEHRDSVFMDVNDQIEPVLVNWRGTQCENEWIKYVSNNPNITRGVDLHSDEVKADFDSKDNCYWDVQAKVSASEQGELNVTIRHNLDDSINDESMAWNAFKIGCDFEFDQPEFDNAYDRCSNYTDGVLDPGATNPHYAVYKYASDEGGLDADDDQSRAARAQGDGDGDLVVGCEQGWTMIQGTCFKVFPENEMSFNQAVATNAGGMWDFCSGLMLDGENLGATFAVVENKEMNAAVRAIAEGYYNPYINLEAVNPTTVSLENPATSFPTKLDMLLYGKNTQTSRFPATAIETVNYLNFADGFPVGQNGEWSTERQCVYMNAEGLWQDVSCKATLEAEGVLCSAPPRLIQRFTQTTTMTTTTERLGACDPRELTSGATPGSGGGSAGFSEYESPNGWVVTTGMPTYSNKEYYWLSNLLDGSSSCKNQAGSTCAQDRDGEIKLHNCYWMSATTGTTWVNVNLPNESFVDYIELDLRIRPSFEVKTLKVKSNRGDHTPFNITGKLADYYNAANEWDGDSGALDCGPLFRINISEWITGVRIANLKVVANKRSVEAKTNPRTFASIGEIKIFGHNPCECDETNPTTTTTTPPAEEMRDNDDDNDDDDPSVTVSVVVPIICILILFFLLLFFILRDYTIVLVFEGASLPEMEQAGEVDLLKQMSAELVVAFSFKNKGGTREENAESSNDEVDQRAFDLKHVPVSQVRVLAADDEGGTAGSEDFKAEDQEAKGAGTTLQRGSGEPDEVVVSVGIAHSKQFADVKRTRQQLLDRIASETPVTIEVGGRILTLVRLQAKNPEAGEDHEEEIELKVIEFEGGVVVPVDSAEVRGTEEFAGFDDGDVGGEGNVSWCSVDVRRCSDRFDRPHCPFIIRCQQ